MDYGQKKDQLIIRKRGTAGSSNKPGIFLYRSGSLRDPLTAISASVPNIIAITCSANKDNVLTKLTDKNSYASITINNGRGGIGDAIIEKGFIIGRYPHRVKDTRLILRYVSSSYKVSASIVTQSLHYGDMFYHSSQSQNDFYIDVPIKDNEDSFAVALKTVNALNKAGNGTIYTASLIDDGSNILNISSSLGENLIVGSTFKIRGGSGIGDLEIEDNFIIDHYSQSLGKFTITSLKSGSVADPDFSGTKPHTGKMKIGSSFKIGDAEPLFKYNIIQSGSGKLNQPHYPGDPIFSSQSLAIEIDPDDKESSIITGSKDAKMYFSSSGLIGVNTKDPKRAFDIVDTTEGIADMALKKSKINDARTFWQQGDDIAQIRFIGQSGSYIDEHVSGAAAAIVARVNRNQAISPGGDFSGDLVFQANKAGASTPYDIVIVGQGHGTTAGMGVTISGSLRVLGGITSSGTHDQDLYDGGSF
jgi:hypothetical protein